MVVFISSFCIYSVIILVIKAIIYNDHSTDRDGYTATEIVFCVLHALRVIFNAWILILFLKQVRLYLSQVRQVVSRQHILKTRLVTAYVSTIMVTNMCFYHFVLPYYYILLLGAEEPTPDSEYMDVIYYATGVLDEATFSLLLIMAYILHSFAKGSERRWKD